MVTVSESADAADASDAEATSTDDIARTEIGDGRPLMALTPTERAERIHIGVPAEEWPDFTTSADASQPTDPHAVFESFDDDLFADFRRFSRAHLWSCDIDPIYPWFKRVFERAELSAAERLWRLYVYVTYYHVGTSLRMWETFGEPQAITGYDLTLPTGTERRCFRGQGDLAEQNLNDAFDAGFFDPDTWAGHTGEDGWRAIRDRVEEIAWNGPWASYKWADLLKHVQDVPITADDIGVGGNSKTAGPIPGMVKLTGAHWKDCATDTSRQKALLAASRAGGVPFDGLDQMETCLCDFNSVLKRHYYVGHDIDLYGGQLAEANGPPEHWQARADVFPDRFLGERNGWDDTRGALQTRYDQTGEIEWWT